MTNLITIVAPLLLLGLGVEWWVARSRGCELHRFDAVFGDIGCGAGQLLTGLFFRAGLIAVYVWLWQHWRLFHLPEHAWWVYVLGLLAVDFSYYVWHRFTHRVRLGWAFHVVHHQTEAYNIAVSMRQSWFSKFTAAPFYAWMAVVGIPPLAMIVGDGLVNLYQYTLHTQLVGSLGRFGLLFNTPALHRVHHGINDRYVDRNFGGILMVWDHLFGTYQREEADDPCVFGIREGFDSWDPVRAQIQPLTELVSEVRAGASPMDWLRPPGPRPAAARGSAIARTVHRSPAVTAYVAVQAALAALVALWVLAWGETDLASALPWVAGLLMTLWTLGRLLDQRSHAWGMEALRVLSIVGIIAVWG